MLFRMQRSATPTLATVVILLLGQTSLAGQSSTTQPLATPPDHSDLPHVTIDRHNATVDLDATVNMQDGRWLELLACTPQMRTHESILVTPAKPSHVHLALVMLGLEPGAPMRWRQVGDEYIADPAHGPRIAVTLVFQQDGQSVEVPANRWVVNRRTGETLDSNVWLFTGSSFDDTQDPPVYRGDIEGSILSLVHFGDEVLARPTELTNQTDQGSLAPHTELIPPVGTPVKIRLRPIQ